LFRYFSAPPQRQATTTINRAAVRWVILATVSRYDMVRAGPTIGRVGQIGAYRTLPATRPEAITAATFPVIHERATPRNSAVRSTKAGKYHGTRATPTGLLPTPTVSLVDRCLQPLRSGAQRLPRTPSSEFERPRCISGTPDVTIDLVTRQ
jgi:hypothetical protein